MRDFPDPKVLGRLSRLQLQARGPMSGSMSGQHKSPHRGASVEFAEYRKYVPGDDIRLLDWRLYGRTDRFYMKEYEADTNLRAYLVVDCSASMGFAARGMQKFEFARKMAATLASLIVRQGDAVGLVCQGEKSDSEVPARRNASHLQTIFRVLTEAKPQGPTNLVKALHQVAERAPRRSMVLIFSDLFADSEDLLQALQHLRHRRHDVAVFHLLDPEELEFGFERPTRFVDMESPATVLAEPQAIREEYLQALTAFLSRMKGGCSEAKVEYRQISTDSEYEQALAKFLLERERL